MYLKPRSCGANKYDVQFSCQLYRLLSVVVLSCRHLSSSISSVTSISTHNSINFACVLRGHLYPHQPCRRPCTRAFGLFQRYPRQSVQQLAQSSAVHRQRRPIEFSLRAKFYVLACHCIVAQYHLSWAAASGECPNVKS